MSLKDFKPDISNFDSGEKSLKDSDSQVSAAIYHEEINSLNIDKLSNRVTIISIIIPCLIGAIIAFAYLDMKERLVGADVTKQSQVDRISQQLEEKLNALDVKIAKNRFDLDNTLPELDKKSISLEGQIAKLASSKADNKAINDQFDKLAKQVANNADQDKTTLLTIEKIKDQTLSQFDTIAQQLRTEIDLFKKEFNARLLELSDNDLQIGELRKNLSIMDKQYKNLESESASQAIVDKQIKQLENDLNNLVNTLDSRIETLNQKLVTNISRLKKDIDQLSNRPSDSTKPKPKINIDSSNTGTIEEKPLKQ
jgi:DNA repair exonuclease SbcCD ATPase subunit